MKKILSIFVAVLTALSLTSCGKTEKESSQRSEDSASGKTETTEVSETSKKSDQPSFAFVVTDQLGDKSFNDSAAEGMKKISDSLGYKTKIIEIGTDQTQWEPTLLDLAESNKYTAIFLPGIDYQEIVERIAPDYPDQKFVLFDVNSKDDSLKNVRSIAYKQNEASYLAGVLAALVTSSDMDFANEDHKIGFIGGDEDPIINDFLVGYIEGAKSILDDVKVYVSYVGSWVDTARVKEIANAQFNDGVDITFPCAGAAGKGAIESAVENSKYIIGVDSDQGSIYADLGDGKTANVILTSVLKNIGESLYLYAKDLGEGKDVSSGGVELGLKDGTVGLAENDLYEKNVSSEIRDQVDKAKEDIISGKVKVPTALKTPPEEVDKIIKAVAPKVD